MMNIYEELMYGPLPILYRCGMAAENRIQQPAAEVNGPANPQGRESGQGLKEQLLPLLEKGVELGVFTGYLFRGKKLIVKRKVDTRGGYETQVFTYPINADTIKTLEQWVQLGEAAQS